MTYTYILSVLFLEHVTLNKELLVIINRCRQMTFKKKILLITQIESRRRKTLVILFFFKKLMDSKISFMRRNSVSTKRVRGKLDQLLSLEHVFLYLIMIFKRKFTYFYCKISFFLVIYTLFPFHFYRVQSVNLVGSPFWWSFSILILLILNPFTSIYLKVRSLYLTLSYISSSSGCVPDFFSLPPGIPLLQFFV